MKLYDFEISDFGIGDFRFRDWRLEIADFLIVDL
jgi:hypothetical protein